MERALAFRVQEHERPAVEVRVNFGLFSGRNATQAEIDELARMLRGEVASFSVVAEERHEFGGDVETSVRQVVIEVPAATDADRLVALAERWARDCIHAWTELGELGTEL
jgi:hypothetical protein